MIPYQIAKKCDNMSIRFTHNIGIGQTDRLGKTMLCSACSCALLWCWCAV